MGASAVPPETKPDDMPYYGWVHIYCIGLCRLTGSAGTYIHGLTDNIVWPQANKLSGTVLSYIVRFLIARDLQQLWVFLYSGIPEHIESVYLCDCLSQKGTLQNYKLV